MAEEPVFIAGDWGTSRLRLYLCSASPGSREPLERLDGPGVSLLGDVPGTFFNLASQWTRKYGSASIILSGMAGSSVGWRETDYLDCPVEASAIAKFLHRFPARGHGVAIVPGLACTNPLGAPDVMRGEETEIMGALQIRNDLNFGRHLLCLPGTHTKWVLLDSARIESFLTGFTGELYSVLGTKSLLAPTSLRHSPSVDQAFQLGVDRALKSGAGDLVGLLFEVRSRRLRGQLAAEDAANFLSGLIVGRDVDSALKAFQPSMGRLPETTLIGSHDLTARYAAVLSRLGLKARLFDCDEPALAGLRIFFSMGMKHGGIHSATA